MLDPTRSARAIILGAIGLCIVASITGAKGEPEKGGPKFAVVDPQRLLTEYAYAVNQTIALQKRNDEEVATLRVMAQNYLLPPDDQESLAKLTILGGNDLSQLTAAQKAQVKTITDRSKELQDQFTALQREQAGAQTQQHKDQLTDFIKRQTDTQTRIESRKKQAEQEIQGKLETARSKATKDVRESIAKVAKDKGYNVVFSNEVVFYCDNDLTDTVLGQLNKK